MRDRESTNILSNGAIRYGIYDENGSLLRYEYIRLEDEPTVAGSIYNRANVMPDAVCDALGVDTTAEPKDAFLALFNRAERNRPSSFQKLLYGRWP